MYKTISFWFLSDKSEFAAEINRWEKWKWVFEKLGAGPNQTSGPLIWPNSFSNFQFSHHSEMVLSVCQLDHKNCLLGGPTEIKLQIRTPMFHQKWSGEITSSVPPFLPRIPENKGGTDGGPILERPKMAPPNEQNPLSIPPKSSKFSRLRRGCMTTPPNLRSLKQRGGHTVLISLIGIKIAWD